MNKQHARAIKVRRVSLIRLANNPPADRTPAQVKREMDEINAQIIRIQKEAEND